jgi:hypothetical protein
MAAGAPESWYHEKESAWLHGAAAAAEARVRAAVLVASIA